MSRTDPQFKLRMPPALRARVEQAAKASMHLHRIRRDLDRGKSIFCQGDYDGD